MQDGPEAPGATGRLRFRFPVRSVALIVATLAGLSGFLLMRGEGGAFFGAFSAVPPRVWGQIMALSCLSYLARFGRWHWFLAGLGYRVPVWADLRIYLAGFALTLTPGKAGETIRSFYLRPLGVPVPVSLGVFVSERLIDLLVVGLVACMALRSFPDQAWVGFVGLGVCIAVALSLRSAVLPALVGRLFGRGLGASMAGATATIRLLLAPGSVLVALAPTLVAWSAQGVSLFLVVSALGHEVDPGGVIGIYCVAILAGAVSFLPGGLGATEAVIVLLLVATDIPAADAVLASLLTRGLTLWLAVLIGLGSTASLALAAPTANEG